MLWRNVVVAGPLWAALPLSPINTNKPDPAAPANNSRDMSDVLRQEFNLGAFKKNSPPQLKAGIDNVTLYRIRTNQVTSQSLEKFFFDSNGDQVKVALSSPGLAYLPLWIYYNNDLSFLKLQPTWENVGFNNFSMFLSDGYL